MPRIGDRVRVRANGRTATIRSVDTDGGTDRYGVVYDDAAGGGAGGGGTEPRAEAGISWFTSDELEVIT